MLKVFCLHIFLVVDNHDFIWVSIALYRIMIIGTLQMFESIFNYALFSSFLFQ